MPTVCLVLCLSAAGPARAQTPSPDPMAAAHELIVTMRAADFFKTIVPALMQSFKPAIVQNQPQVERDYDAIVPLLLEGMNARLNELNEQGGGLRQQFHRRRTARGRRVLPPPDPPQHPPQPTP